MRSPTALAFFTLAFALAACGGDDGGSGTIDASTIDSPPGAIDAAIDAPGPASALGRPCMGTGQGDCPADYVCLNLNGASGKWCSKACTSVQDTSCEDGYAGPGFPRCQFNVNLGGGVMQTMCAVMCDDPAGGPMLCPGGAAQCNGTCPGALHCTFNVLNMQGQTVGKACL